MTTNWPRAASLVPTSDPVDLIGALVDLPRDQIAGVRDQLAVLADHPDVDVRLHAIRRLFVHHSDVPYRRIVVKHFECDPHPKVRRAAAYGVMATSTPETRRQDTQTLLNRLRDVLEETYVRGAAYEALLLLLGKTDFPPANRDIDLNRDVDWNWINSLEDESKLIAEP